MIALTASVWLATILQVRYGAWMMAFHRGAWKEVEDMARKSGRPLINMRPAIEYLGLDEVLRQAGKERLSEHLGEILRQVGKKKVVKQQVRWSQMPHEWLLTAIINRPNCSGGSVRRR